MDDGIGVAAQRLKRGVCDAPELTHGEREGAGVVTADDVGNPLNAAAQVLQVAQGAVGAEAFGKRQLSRRPQAEEPLHQATGLWSADEVAQVAQCVVAVDPDPPERRLEGGVEFANRLWQALGVGAADEVAQVHQQAADLLDGLPDLLVTSLDFRELLVLGLQRRDAGGVGLSEVVALGDGVDNDLSVLL